MSGLLSYFRDEAAGDARNFLQGASNSAASTISAPVDGMAWLMRKMGIPVPAAPVGGSDWMAQRGLTAAAPGKAGLLGETAGMVLPIVAQAKAPQIAKGLLTVEANAAKPSPAMWDQRGAVLAKLKDGPQYATKDLGRYTDRLYRQADLMEADAFIPGSQTQVQPKQAWFANEPDYALGQGNNSSGVLMEFAAKNMRGQLSMNKPGARQMYDKGYAEFVAADALPSEFSGNLLSLKIPSGANPAQARRIRATAKSAGFTESVLGGGTIVLTRPEAM